MTMEKKNHRSEAINKDDSDAAKGRMKQNLQKRSRTVSMDEQFYQRSTISLLVLASEITNATANPFSGQVSRSIKDEESSQGDDVHQQKKLKTGIVSSEEGLRPKTKPFELPALKNFRPLPLPPRLPNLPAGSTAIFR